MSVAQRQRRLPAKHRDLRAKDTVFIAMAEDIIYLQYPLNKPFRALGDEYMQLCRVPRILPQCCLQIWLLNFNCIATNVRALSCSHISSGSISTSIGENLFVHPPRILDTDA